MQKSSVFAVLLGCLGCGEDAADSGPEVVGDGRFVLDAWADNWFAVDLGDREVGEDSVPITTERSFNAERIAFDGDYPLVLNFILKDYKEDDTGLEYIGAPNQQMGDAGFIMQLRDTTSGAVVAVSSAAWRCTVIHRPPLNPDCEQSADPASDCLSEISDEPAGWMAEDYDVSAWETAHEYTAAQVGTKDGYDEIAWDAAARLIWTADLEADNTLLCKVVVPAP